MNLDAHNYILPKSSMIQPAVIKNCAWWKVHIAKLAGELTTKAKEYRMAVKEFKEGGAWKSEFKTWAACSRETLGISPQRANELIRDITEHWDDTLETPLSTVLDNACKSSTSDVSPKTTDQSPYTEKPGPDLQKSPPKEAPILDKVGHKIPPYALTYWNRASEIQHVLSTLSDLRTTIKKANVSGDKLWCAHDTQDLLLSFDALYQSVSNFAPYAVCKKCNGMETKTLCSMCHGTGLINKVTFGFNKS